MANLSGTGGDDTLVGSVDDDTFTGGAGDDLIDGVSGVDVVVSSGPAQQYRLGVSAGRLVMTDTFAGDGDDGTDTLWRVQTLRFSDREYSLVAELRVNSTLTGDQRSPAICGLAGGGTLVAWQSPQPGGTGNAIFAQRFDDAGNPLGDAASVGPTTAFSRSDAALTALGNGNAVIVWTADGGDGSLGGVFAQVVDPSAAAVGGEFQVNAYTAGEQRDASVAALAGGGFVVSWTSQLQDGSGEGVYMRRYSSAGAPAGGAARVNTFTAGDQKASAVAALADGGFVVVWQSLQQDGSGFGVFAQRYNAGGTAQGAEFRVNTAVSGHQLTPHVAGLDGGGAVVVWASQYQDGSGYGVYAQVLDAAGAAVGGEVLVNETTASDQNAPRLTALGSGGFAVSWTSRNQDGAGLGVYARAFDAGGQPVGSEFRVNATTLGHQMEPALSALAGGGFAVAWVGTGQDAVSGGIYLQIFDDAGSAIGPILVRGTGGDDYIDLSGAGALSAEGLGGDDTYVVNEAADAPFESVDAGSDTVIASISWTLAPNFEDLLLSGSSAIDGTGNSAANRIEGNSADNLLDGSSGSDVLTGGDGDDTYVVDAGDQVVELAGEGVDAVFSSVSWTLGTEFEDLTLTGAGALNGTGNAKDNAITGNAGANSLTGLGGRDLLVGGAGADTLQGGSGIDTVRGGPGDDRYYASVGDQFEESAGEGIDSVASGIDWTLPAEFENLSLIGSASVDGEGNASANVLAGNIAANLLSGAAGNDSINGYGGMDTLSGGPGEDTLTGGGGSVRDVFLFDSALGAGEADLLTDFQVAPDRIALDDDIFDAFNAGVSTTVAASRFHKGAGTTTAHDADDRLIYDTSTGALYYDPDGTGASPAVQFATIGTTTHANITATNFLIVA